jgi:diamine N-acetyltransferase
VAIYRSAELNDLQALSELGRQTFSETFGHLYSAANLAAFLAQTHGIPTLSEELKSPMRIYRLAEEQRQLVGYCKLGLDALDGISPPSLPLALPGRKVIELKQLYLRPSQFGTGVGDTLMEWALDFAQARGAHDVILSVYSDNPRAQRFYQRYGFAHAGDCVFMVGEHRDDEYLYRLKLRA